MSPSTRENSYKYSLEEIDEVTAAAGLEINGQWFDSGKRFSLNRMKRLQGGRGAGGPPSLEAAAGRRGAGEILLTRTCGDIPDIAEINGHT